MKIFGYYLIILNLVALSRGAFVYIENGSVEGTVWNSTKNVTFNAFLKIPYAMPPLGKLRFQDPVPYTQKWDGIYDGTKYGPMCVQISPGNPNPMDEDCLHLNVFSSICLICLLRPVIIYFHGGSFERGSAINHQPHYMMDRNVVLVTVNFRFGPMGFLSTGTPDAYGNQGLKDQALAIKWVKRNIKKFGGDPNKITLAGLSSGSIMATAHMVSPMTEVGAFHRIIAMSGTIGSFGVLKSDTLPIAKSLASQLNCPIDNIANMISCLQDKPALDIIRVNVRTSIDCFFGATWQPVIENDHGQTRFLTQQPFDVFKGLNNANYIKVPIMAGVTEQELTNQVPTVLSIPQFNQFWLSNFNAISATCFNLEKFSSASTLFKKVYVPTNSLDLRSIDTIGNMISDGFLGYGTRRLIDIISSQTDVFHYKFSYSGRYSIFNYPRSFPYGVAHSDDLQYIFSTWFVGPTIRITDPEYFMVERMTSIWEQFATTGNLYNSTNFHLATMQWPKYNLQDKYYLDIGKNMVEKKGLFLERYNAFDELLNGPAV